MPGFAGERVPIKRCHLLYGRGGNFQSQIQKFPEFVDTVKSLWTASDLKLERLMPNMRKQAFQGW